jgi:hypothetical protein
MHRTKNTITMGQLAKLINEGFKTTATKEDVKALEENHHAARKD